MKILLVYYSYTNQTKIIVDKINSMLDCDIVELKPIVPFGEYEEVAATFE